MRLVTITAGINGLYLMATGMQRFVARSVTRGRMLHSPFCNARERMNHDEEKSILNGSGDPGDPAAANVPAKGGCEHVN